MTKILAALILLLLLNHPSIIFAQSEARLVNAINEKLIPLSTLSPDSDFKDLQPLKALLADKPIIAIGEATHGTHEFFAFKHRMLKFLVKEMDVKAFLMEGDFGGTQIMNDYVINGKGDIKKGLAGIGFGVWMTQEVADMVEWIKAYNSTQAPENKVRFFGIDMQWGFAAMQLIKDSLAPANRFSPLMEEAFTYLKKPGASLTDQQKLVIVSAIDSISRLPLTTGDTALFRHDVRELQQYMGYLDAESNFFPAKQSDWRDKCMSENVEWIYNYTKQEKLMIWAHNAHVSKSSGSQIMQRMGMFLAADLKDKYYAMGFDFYEGQMRSFDTRVNQFTVPSIQPAKNNSSGAVFAQCRVPDFILDLKTAASNNDINDFLNKKVASVFLGPSYNPKLGLYYIMHKLANTYDAVIFIRETSAAQTIRAPAKTNE